jgi:hypothetical protein
MYFSGNGKKTPVFVHLIGTGDALGKAQIELVILLAMLSE